MASSASCYWDDATAAGFVRKAAAFGNPARAARQNRDDVTCAISIFVMGAPRLPQKTACVRHSVQASDLPIPSKLE
jgi:hypothetical protein